MSSDNYLWLHGSITRVELIRGWRGSCWAQVLQEIFFCVRLQLTLCKTCGFCRAFCDFVNKHFCMRTLSLWSSWVSVCQVSFFFLFDFVGFVNTSDSILTVTTFRDATRMILGNHSSFPLKNLLTTPHYYHN